ncbi:HAD hydrolase family protein [Brachybacterium sp. GCM10030268]|uniref:HAD hydrolase family protein n=1 Tax=Brachybacterium sp. GCM10030268 TaxID=3273382 RepID=UPI00361088F0
MPARHCVFIDFDGTFAAHGVAPPQHADAVRRARSAGHTVLLCTGRPASIVAPDVAALFDGVVASAGAYVRVGTDVLRDTRFPQELGRRSVEILQGHGVAFALEAPEALYCTPETAARIRAGVGSPQPGLAGGVGRGPQDIVDAARTPADLATCSFAKISLWGSPVRVEQLAEEIGPEVGALPNSIAQDDTSSGELHLREIDKADGVRQVAGHLGIELTATVGIGDGMNDLGMVRAAGTGVVIHGAPAALREAADLEVPGPAEHGVLIAFERLGLL